jgi:outer membrane protein assembly factor BamB
MTRYWLMAASAMLLSVLASCAKNRPPETPVAPLSGTVVVPGDSVEFRLSSSDPEGYSISFRCSWGNGDTSGWSLWVASGETSMLRYAWRQVGRYEVTAQARDAQEALSGWSNAVEILVGNPPRRPTRPDGPHTGWIDTSYSYVTVATDLDADDIRYVFDWGDGAVDTTSFHETGTYVTVAHTWAVADTFSVLVRALDRPGLASAWSETLRVAMRDIDGPGVILWRYELGSGVRVTGVPAIDGGGRVLFGASDGLLRCLDADGSREWTFAAGGPILSSPAVAADGSVIFGSADGRVYCLDGAGGLRWDYATGGGVISSPALGGDGSIAVGSDDGRLYSLDPGGALRWSYATGGAVRSSPALGSDGTVYFGSGDSFVYAINQDGTLAWRYATGGVVDASPAVGGDGTVYAAGRDGWLYALRDGSLLWREQIGIGTSCSPAVASDGNIYVGSEAGRVLAFYPVGGPVWELGVPDAVRSSPLVDSDLIVYFGSGRRFYAVNSFGAGSIEWYLTLPGEVEASATVTESGVIYVGDAAGNLWAVRGSGRIDTGAWPKFRRDVRNTGRAGSS